MKIKYIDLGLPSGTLWSEHECSLRDGNSGITPTNKDWHELWQNKINDRLLTTVGPNGQAIYHSPLVSLTHFVKYGS